jgi:integrase
VRAVITELEGRPRLIATLLYGSGLRLLECCRLRVQDIDFGMNQILVRDGKGAKDRVTMLPGVARDALSQQLQRARRQHQADLARGAGWVELPSALARKYPNAGRQWAWQWVFRGFDFPDFELAWEVLAGVTTAQLPPERRQEAKEAVQATMWPHGRGPRHFRNVTQFLVGRVAG